jgi:hypothetical protein
MVLCLVHYQSILREFKNQTGNPSIASVRCQHTLRYLEPAESLVPRACRGVKTNLPAMLLRKIIRTGFGKIIRIFFITHQ